MLGQHMLHKIKILSHARSPKGFTAVELLAALIIFSILSTMAVVGVLQYEKKACRVILEYDLKKFFEAEAVFYGEHDTFKGTIGDIISNDPIVLSTFDLETFLPSRNTSITIIKDVPLTVVGRNESIELTYEYSLTSGMIIER